MNNNIKHELTRIIGFTQIPPGEIAYRGIKANDSVGPLTVWRCGEGEVVRLSAVPSQKAYNHSPDGFQWGYSGSGPAQLALAILLDATGDKEISLRLHQIFKAQFVAGWGVTWQISRGEILEWVKKYEVVEVACPLCGEPLGEEKHFHSACANNEQAKADQQDGAVTKEELSANS